MVIGDLHILQLRIQLSRFIEEIDVAPKALGRRGFGIFFQRFQQAFVGRVLLFLGIEILSVGLFIPPGVAEVGVDEEIALVLMAGEMCIRDRNPDSSG